MKENSIEETIKIIERKIKEAEHYTDITGLCLTLDKELCNAFINILSDYKRVLKEVKRYKNMYEAEKRIHMVRNEQLDRKQKAIIKCNELENEIEEKDKIINVMAEYISKKEILVDKHCYALTAEAVKQWFEKQIK